VIALVTSEALQLVSKLKVTATSESVRSGNPGLT
jgi:hypothetical protein